jgi:polyphosphate kinase
MGKKGKRKKGDAVPEEAAQAPAADTCEPLVTVKEKRKKKMSPEELTERLEEGVPVEVLLDDPALYLNREVAWVRFNDRVMEEARDKTHPLLERVKFLAIVGNNLDEFFMIRVSGLRRQLSKGALEVPPDKLTPQEQLKMLRAEIVPHLDELSACWHGEVLPDLARAGIHIERFCQLSEENRQALRFYFENTIFPALTPLALDLTHPFPFISNLSLNLAVVIRDPKGGENLARIKVPTTLFPRFIPITGEDEADRRNGQSLHFVLLEDLVASNLDLLFPGMDVMASHLFRITRDADIEIELDEAEDLLTAVEDGVEARRIGAPCRLEVDSSMPERLMELFATKLGLQPGMVYQTDAPLSLSDLWQLWSLNRPDLKDAPFLPTVPPALADEKKIIPAVQNKDYVLYHPYDSFQTVVNLLKAASVDPDVLAIKIALYRIDKHSPIVDALIEARENGKGVAALVELKARFDEENNIVWAKALEHAGVHVVYGLVDLKVHAKLCLIVRKTKGGIVRICHLSSGNYNSSTARIYGDIGYLTAREDIGADVSDLFNALTGYSNKTDYKRLLVAPHSLRSGFLERIEREIHRQRAFGDGYIAFKLNALVDKEVIRALYRASMSGVKVDLNIRGMCCLLPGIKGISENITVTSIVGRFLEHSRIYYFRNGGEEEVLLGSADMMPRNLNRRVEVLFPVLDKDVRRAIIDEMLKVHLADNVKARRMLPTGHYERIEIDGKAVNSQELLIRNRGRWHALY